ncbi:MAG: oxidoreductase [Steroidobacteraceae bacterium]|jgi:glycine/D-amino acid oxidase-like deaminating enzyme|nr:oxidoreductase [Steroidobacteraceae bacterium]
MWPFRRSSAFDVRSSQPYWLLRDGMGDAGPALPGPLDCDVAIVGAGITGALIADALVATGLRVLVLDQREPALGSTAASTALLQYENDTHLTDLAQMLGAERATLAYRACVRSFTLLEERFPELLAESDYQRRESVYLAADEKAVDALRTEVAARRAIGIHVDWLDEAELRRLHGCRRPCAIVSPLAATLDPLRFTRGVLSACVRHGVRVYSRARVERIEELADALLLHVAGGANVRAGHVVVAAGYESMRFAPPVADIDNTFALVTDPLADTRRAAALPQIWESARPYLYLRGTRDGRVMLGGADVPFKNAMTREALLPRQVRKLAAAYEDLFGEKLPPIAHAWAGSFATTPDGLPFIGRVPGWNPRLQFALCYGGNGITFAVHAGDIVRAGIEGREHPLEPVFGFGRSETVRRGEQGGAGKPTAAVES